MQWFPFQGIVLNAANNIKSPEEHFQSLLKVFTMFNIRIWYDESIVHKSIPCGVFGPVVVRVFAEIEEN